MSEEKENQKIIGAYALCNTAAICVHAIDYAEDKVLVSINGENPEWCDITAKPHLDEDGCVDESRYDEDTWEPGFYLGAYFVPFSEVMRV